MVLPPPALLQARGGGRHHGHLWKSDHKSLKLIILCQLYLVGLNLLGYFLVGAEEKGRHWGNIGYDLVGLRDACGYYLVGGAGYEFVGYE